MNTEPTAPIASHDDVDDAEAFERLGRSAAREVRRPAPEAVLADVERRGRSHQRAIMVATVVGGATALGLAVVGVAALVSSDDGAPTEPAPSSTVASVRPVVGPGERWVAYQTPGDGIHLLREDGTGYHRLTSEQPPRLQDHADWSPSGDRLAFDAGDDDATTDVWITNADGSSVERLVDCVAPCVAVIDPAWSPDGTSIAYARLEPVRIQIEVIDVATRSIEVIRVAPARSDGIVEFFAAPRWSPDGTRLVVEIATKVAGDGADATTSVLGIIERSGSPSDPVAPLTNPALHAAEPDWSPRGDLLVFTGAVGPDPAAGTTDLYTLPVEGGTPQRITFFGNEGGLAQFATFDPDRPGIVFSYRTGPTGTGAGGQLMGTVAADGGPVTPAVGGSPTPGVQPRWRPT